MTESRSAMDAPPPPSPPPPPEIAETSAVEAADAEADLADDAGPRGRAQADDGGTSALDAADAEADVADAHESVDAPVPDAADDTAADSPEDQDSTQLSDADLGYEGPPTAVAAEQAPDSLDSPGTPDAPSDVPAQTPPPDHAPPPQPAGEAEAAEAAGPVDPADPADPVDPGDPGDPGDQVEPTEPTEPTERREPTEPADPADRSDGREAVEPLKPTEAVDLAEVEAAGPPASGDTGVPEMGDLESRDSLAAGYGHWQRLDAQEGGAVGQFSKVSCVSACGEMLSEGEKSQSELVSQIGAPAAMADLPAALGPEWKGALVEPVPNAVDIAVDHAPCGVGMFDRSEGGMEHMVILDGQDENGLLMIRDPQDGGVTYKMERAEFENHWNGALIYR
jgi:hypothetical protein